MYKLLILIPIISTLFVILSIRTCPVESNAEHFTAGEKIMSLSVLGVRGVYLCV